MLLAAGPARVLGGEPPTRIRFSGPQDTGRHLLLDDKPAFELSFWCGTCQFLFQRLEGADSTCSIDEATHLLAAGLAGADDDVVTLFGSVLPRGTYRPLLLSVRPRLVQPAGPGDYFATEQVATWGVNPFWGLPEHPRTPYYRTAEIRVDAGARLFEFVVPMVPPSWNTAERVAEYTAELAGGATPAAVAVSTLDVCAPAMDIGTDYYQHWGLTHFLLDGHHKMQAAAATGRPLQVLSLLAMDASLATPAQLARIPDLLA